MQCVVVHTTVLKCGIKVEDVMKKVNVAALPNTALSLHQLTEQEVVAAQKRQVRYHTWISNH